MQYHSIYGITAVQTYAGTSTAGSPGADAAHPAPGVNFAGQLVLTDSGRPRNRDVLATIPRAQLRLILGAGHLCPLQRVDDFVKLVTGWVDAA